MLTTEVVSRIEYVISKLQEKGYEPYDQLACYVLLHGNENYITKHGDARNLIKGLDINDIREYLNRYNINRNKFKE